MSNTPSDEELKGLLPTVQLDRKQEPKVQVWLTQKDAIEYARAVLAKWGTPQPVVREPLTLQQIAKAFAEAGLDPDDYPDDVMIEPLVCAIEQAHGIMQKGGQHG